MLEGNVLITGGAGFLARGIYRRAKREGWRTHFTCLSRDDAKHERLRALYPDVTIVRGDICADRDWLTRVAAGHDLVIHAAAIKYVDAAELNVLDTIRVNIDGSRNLAMACMRAEVPHVIGISTDKAAMPVNIYGMTKAAMERIFIECHRISSRTAFDVVRYGNVVGSTGSVIPKFKQQLERNGEVLVTDPAMTRFWMSVDEAIDVILNVGPVGGRTVIPVPRAMSLLNVVHAAVGDMTKVRVIGHRPGEKLHETLIHEQESLRVTRVGEYFYMAPPGIILSEKPFELTSADPLGGWMTAAEMLELVAEAETI